LRIYFKESALPNWESVVKINMQVNQPTAEQIKAIITWADRMGRFWRRELHSAWMDGNYQGNRDISSGLQQVRNEFGPEWLVKFNLKAAKAAQAAPEPVLEQITGPVEPCPVSDRELAAYQPKIVLDAITNALQKPAASAPAASQSSSWEDITEQCKETGPIETIEFKVREYFNWDLGYSWISVTIGGVYNDGLALYAKKHNGEAHKWVAFSLKSAVAFFADLKAPARAVATILRHAESECPKHPIWGAPAPAGGVQ
jgi:hypothetical protein